VVLSGRQRGSLSDFDAGRRIRFVEFLGIDIEGIAGT
jgi:hypothetical protein